MKTKSFIPVVFLYIFISFISCNQEKISPVDELKLIGQKLKEHDIVEYSYKIKDYTSYSGDTTLYKGKMYFENNPRDTAIGMNFYNRSFRKGRHYSKSFYNGKYLITLMPEDSFVYKKPLCDYYGGHMTVYPYLEMSYGAIKLFLNDTAFYSNVDSLDMTEVSFKGKKYFSFSFRIAQEIINTFKIGIKNRNTKVKLIVRKKDHLPVFYSQYQEFQRKTHKDFIYIEAKFNNYIFDKAYPDSMFLIESIPAYFRWDKFKHFMDVLPVGTQALEWELPKVGGNNIGLSDFAGKYVLLDFWFIGCGACIESIPILNDLQSKYNDGLVIIGVNCFNDHEDKIKQYCKDMDMKYLNLWKGDEITEKYRIKGAPIFYLIDSRGKIVYSQVGHNSEKLTNAVKRFVGR